MPPAKTKQTQYEEFQDAVSTAVSSLLKAANHALQTAQEEGREEVRKTAARAEETARQRDELRDERDTLLRDKHTVHVEYENAKSEADKWRILAEKAEWLAKQQTENVSELRDTIKEIRISLKECQVEAQQWKTKFMRADEERYALSVTNADLVSRQLYANSVANAFQTPLTPRSQDPTTLRGVSLGTYVTGPGSGNGYLSDGELSRRHTQGDSSHAHGERRKSRQSNASGSRQQPVTTSKVLRRVHVVMENGGTHRNNSVEVKEEDSSESVPLSTPSRGEPLSPSFEEESTDSIAANMEPGAATPRAAQKMKGKGKKAVNTNARTGRQPRASTSVTATGRRSQSQQARGQSQSHARKNVSRRGVERAEDFSDESDYEEEQEFDRVDQQTRGRKRFVGEKDKRRAESSSNSLGLFDDEVGANDRAGDEEEEDELMLGSGASRRRALSQTHIQAGASHAKKRGSPYPSNVAGTTVVGSGSNKRPRKR